MEFQSTIDNARVAIERSLEILQIGRHPTNRPEKKILLGTPVIEDLFRDEMLAAVSAELIAEVMMQLTKPLEGLIVRRNDTCWSWADEGFFDFATQFSTDVVAALDRLGDRSYAIISPSVFTILQAASGDFDSVVNRELLPDGNSYMALGMPAVFRHNEHVLFVNGYANDEIPVFCIGENAIQYSGIDLVGIDNDSFWTDLIFTFDESRVNLVDIHFPSVLVD
jgi:hypothetical protein